MMKKTYAIIDTDLYAKEIRHAAAESLSENNTDNLDHYISIGQINNIIKTECLGLDDENRPILNEQTNEEIYEQIVVWIHNVGLAKLAAQGLIECAWDDTENEMIFWPGTSNG